MTAASEWEQWEARWRAARTSAADLDALIARTTRARRNVVLVHHLSTAMAVAGIAVVVAALRHAGNAFEVALGLIVALGIAAVWRVDVANRRSAADKLDAPDDDYRAARRVLCLRQDRFARLSWVVIALDLAFLVPWWIGGIGVHGAGFHLAQILTIWGPLALMAAFVGWTIVLRRGARAELQRLDSRGLSTNGMSF